MPLEVIVVENYEIMSDAAASILILEMSQATVLEGRKFNLGLAAGSSPLGLYLRIAQRQGEFDPTNIRSWNLDEYAGLPENHPESYAFQMEQNLFGKLNPRFAKIFIPEGDKIDAARLEGELKEKPQTAELDGRYSGKAIVIKTFSGYTGRIKRTILVPYLESIVSAGGIDWQIAGVGRKGHIGFHESGVPLEYGIMLVKLSDETIADAVKDGHFLSAEEAPKYAVSLGAEGLMRYSKNILVLASGDRKTEAIAKALLGPMTSDSPISAMQKRIGSSSKVIYVVDEIAAAEILGRERKLTEKGIKLRDIRRSASLYS